MGLGAMICFEQEFHAARDVTKSHTSRVDTFVSGEHGKLGEVDAGQVFVHRKPTLRKTYAPSSIDPNVELIQLTIGSTYGYIRYGRRPEPQPETDVAARRERSDLPHRASPVRLLRRRHDPEHRQGRALPLLLLLFEQAEERAVGLPWIAHADGEARRNRSG